MKKTLCRAIRLRAAQLPTTIEKRITYSFHWDNAIKTMTPRTNRTPFVVNHARRMKRLLQREGEAGMKRYEKKFGVQDCCSPA